MSDQKVYCYNECGDCTNVVQFGDKEWKIYQDVKNQLIEARASLSEREKRIAKLEEFEKISIEGASNLKKKIFELEDELDVIKDDRDDIYAELQNVEAELVQTRQYLRGEGNTLIDELNETVKKLRAELSRTRKALRDLVEAIEAVHDDPEYQAVFILYQNHVPSGYKGREYTTEFDAAQQALKEAGDERD